MCVWMHTHAMYVCRMYSDRDCYKEIAKKLREGCGETPLPQRPSQDSQDRGDGVLKRYETLEAFERRLAAILPAYDVKPRVMRARDSQRKKDGYARSENNSIYLGRV